jgi:hypothetical protein
MGYHPAPLAPLSKVPSYGYPLVEHHQRRVFVVERSKWFRKDSNVAFITGHLVVVDIDRKEVAREIYRTLRMILKTCVETRRGLHMFFQSRSPDFPSGKLAEGDVKAMGGYVVAPESVVFDSKDKTRWTYRCLNGHPLVPVNELPLIDEDWLNTLRPEVPQRTALKRGEIRDAIAYVMKIESEQGKHGSHGLVRAISILRDAGMTEAEATVVMLDWNQKVPVPSWPVFEVTRAISRNYAKVRK